MVPHPIWGLGVQMPSALDEGKERRIANVSRFITIFSSSCSSITWLCSKNFVISVVKMAVVAIVLFFLYGKEIDYEISAMFCLSRT